MTATRVETEFTANDRDLRRKLDQLDARMGKFAATTARASSQSAKSLQGIGGSIDRIGPALRGLGGLFAAAFSTQEVVGLADEFTRFQAKLINAKVASQDMAKVQGQLFAAAKANGQGVVELADLYGNMAMSAKSLGLNQEQMMTATQGVAAAMRLSGSTTAQSSATILQLGQALAGGTVRAEEYNSMLENAPALVRAVAESSKEWGGDLGKLRKEINDGKVSSQEWAKAILDASAKLQSDAAQAPLTVAAGMQNLRTSMVEYIGAADQTFSASEKLGFALKMLGENLDLVGNSLMIVSAFLISRAIGSMAAYTATQVAAGVASIRLTAFSTAMTASLTGVSRASLVASAAMTKLNGAMAFFGGPIGLAITAVAAAVVGLGTVAKNTTQMNEEFAASMKSTNEILRQARDITNKAAGETKAIGDNSAGAVSGVNGLAGATRNLANETFRLADANAAAAQNAIYKQIAENREKIAERRNPSNWRRAGEALGMRYNGGQHAGRYARDVRLEEAAQLEAANVELNIEAMKLGVLNPDSRYVSDRSTTSSTDGSRKTGGGGGGGGSRSNQITAEERAANDEQVLAAARRRNIDALNALAETSDQRYGNALFMIDLEALEVEKAIKKQQADKQISDAAATEALSINENTRLEERRAEDKRRGLEIEQERADAAREALELDQAISRLQQDTLRNRASMADTMAERTALEAAEFALYQQSAKADFDARQAETRARLKLADQLTSEAERRLSMEADQFAQFQKSESDRRDRDVRNQNPFAAYVDKARDMKASLQSVAAEGLGELENGLVDVMTRTQEMGAMFSNVSKQIIADLARIAIQKAIVAPLANFLGFGSGANIFSMFGGGGTPAIGGDSGGLLPGSLMRNAIGTRFSPGGLTLVGEGGPELVNMPRGSQVLPNGDVRKLAVQQGAASKAPVFSFQTVVHANDAVMAGQIRRDIAQANIAAVQQARELVSQDMMESSKRGLRR